MNKDLIIKYAPYIFFDQKEPFFPVLVGTTVFEKSGLSKSFPREIRFFNDKIKTVIEYSIYWHFDIQHLYELEHVWIYIGNNEEVYDCEASFHGKYLKGLLKDKSNLIAKTHVKLFSQPGKHAFLPRADMFDLIPNLYSVCCEDAGNAGLIVTDVGRGRYKTNEEINNMVHDYLKRYRFIPTMKFEKYILQESIFVEWFELCNRIPDMIKNKLQDIKAEMEYKQKISV